MRTAVLVCLAAVTVYGAPPPAETDAFVSGEGGYHTYRIPSVIVTKQWTLLAFCEGWKNSRSDTGDIDLLLRRSSDGGKTWSKAQVVWDDGPNTCGNPCPVVDRDTGVVWLLLTWNSGKVHERGIPPGFGEDSRRVFVTHSKDDGATWAKPVNCSTSCRCFTTISAPTRGLGPPHRPVHRARRAARGRPADPLQRRYSQERSGP